MIDPKYHLNGEVKVLNGVVTLHRLEALRDFSDVKKGDKGGWVESEDNLSHNGDCWVYDDAKVYQSAQVSGDAQIRNIATVNGYADVSGSARVVNETHVCDKSIVTDNAIISQRGFVMGHATVEGNASILGVSRAGGHSTMKGHSVLSGDARLDGRVRLTHTAHVLGDVVVRDNAEIGEGGYISTDLDYIVVNGVDTDHGSLTLYRSITGDILAQRGNFMGSVDDFLESIDPSVGYHEMLPCFLAYMNSESNDE